MHGFKPIEQEKVLADGMSVKMGLDGVSDIA